jgi:hypothetical protein
MYLEDLEARLAALEATNAELEERVAEAEHFLSLFGTFVTGKGDLLPVACDRRINGLSARVRRLERSGLDLIAPGVPT